jgi:uncharacterized protein YpmB
MERKKLIIILSIVLGVLIIAAILFLVLKKDNPNEAVSAEASETAEIIETTTASASVVATKTAAKTVVQTPTATATAVSKSKIELIKEALSAKFSQTITDASISKESENSAYGSFDLGQEGGYFVAVKDGAGWKIIADGNGTIECSILDANNVPASVVSSCYDTPTESTKNR